MEQWLTLSLEEFIFVFLFWWFVNLIHEASLPFLLFVFTGEYLWLLSQPGPQLLVHCSALRPPLRRPSMVSEDNCFGCCALCCKYHNRTFLWKQNHIRYWRKINLPSLDASILQPFMIRDAPNTKSDTEPGCWVSKYDTSHISSDYSDTKLVGFSQTNQLTFVRELSLFQQHTLDLEIWIDHIEMAGKKFCKVQTLFSVCLMFYFDMYEQ